MAFLQDFVRRPWQLDTHRPSCQNWFTPPSAARPKCDLLEKKLDPFRQMALEKRQTCIISREICHCPPIAIGGRRGWRPEKIFDLHALLTLRQLPLGGQAGNPLWCVCVWAYEEVIPDSQKFGPLRTTALGVWVRAKGPNFLNFKSRRSLRQEKFGPLLTRRRGPNPNPSDPEKDDGSTNAERSKNS